MCILHVLSWHAQIVLCMCDMSMSNIKQSLWNISLLILVLMFASTSSSSMTLVLVADRLLLTHQFLNVGSTFVVTAVPDVVEMNH